MANIFRSRGIRIKKNILANKLSINMKRYYNIDKNILEEFCKKNIVDKCLSCFEYSINDLGKIDSFNFHVDLNMLDDNIYIDQPIEIKNIIFNIKKIFDDSFRNYTIGYRLENNKFIGKTFYFYPTIWKKDHYGIQGVTNLKYIEEYYLRFIKYFDFKKGESMNELRDFWFMIKKFKGISISLNTNNQIEYKIYARFDRESIYNFIKTKTSVDLSFSNKYEPLILVAQRIVGNKITGYNLYYIN